MKTLQEEWDTYVAACYPDGVPLAQLKECRQAFMAGAMAQSIRYSTVTHQAVQHYQKLGDETIEEARPR